MDNKKLTVVVSNIAVSEQIGELYIRCKYGCRLSEDGINYTVDPSTCPMTVKIRNRRSVVFKELMLVCLMFNVPE